jgi:hypothetical protein
MAQEPIAGLHAGPSTADLVLERLPSGEFAWLRPETECRLPSDSHGRACAIGAPVDQCPDETRGSS